MNVSIVTPESLDAVWADLEPMIKRGLGRAQGDCHTLDSMKEAVRRGEFQMFVAHDGDDIRAGMVVSVVEYPARRICFVEMLAGRDMTWFDEHFHLLEKFRDLNDASTIQAACGDGMAKYLQRKGWHRKATIMEFSA